MIETATNVFVIDAIGYCVSGVVSHEPSTSARPTASDHSTSPARKTAALTLGARCSACAFRRSRPYSGSGKNAERAGNRLARLLDVLVRHVQMGDGADPRRVNRVRQQHALLADPLESGSHRQPKRRDVELDEVRLDR